ncbi:hypothetical protein [Flagellimonas myxillae]|uniref:hypothetical protein n=1 Tax=Flagellimonas myxillae TaxID=2942214 RepID=UPI00201F2D81|nr:hypothetical protein [Muricauda myxillae]MCL6266038.1 hypothetical protein [Muricauda myxillae]
METTKRRRGKMQGANIYIFIACLVLNVSCFGQGANAEKEYTIKFYKSKDNNSSHLIIDAYHLETPMERCPAFYYVNNIIINKEGKLETKFLRVLPGKFMIEASFISKQSKRIKKLNIQKGDSIRVVFFLKDDSSPLHPNGLQDIVVPNKE